MLRPLLAAQWILDKKVAPPMLFDELVDAELDEELRPELNRFGYKYLVLGAWGCGAFGNDSDTVARLFYKELKAYKEKVCDRENMYHTLKDCFRRIAFGVLDRTTARRGTWGRIIRMMREYW